MAVSGYEHIRQFPDSPALRIDEKVLSRGQRMSASAIEYVPIGESQPRGVLLEDDALRELEPVELLVHNIVDAHHPSAFLKESDVLHALQVELVCLQSPRGGILDLESEHDLAGELLQCRSVGDFVHNHALVAVFVEEGELQSGLCGLVVFGEQLQEGLDCLGNIRQKQAFASKTEDFKSPGVHFC